MPTKEKSIDAKKRSQWWKKTPVQKNPAQKSLPHKSRDDAKEVACRPTRRYNRTETFAKCDIAREDNWSYEERGQRRNPGGLLLFRSASDLRTPSMEGANLSIFLRRGALGGSK